MLSSFRIVINTELVTLLSPFHSYEESSAAGDDAPGLGAAPSLARFAAKCARTMSTCPRRRTRPSASSSRALSCAPAPGHMAGMGAPQKRSTEAAERLPAVMQQLHHLMQCTCTAFACFFFSCTAHTCGSSIFSLIGFGASWPGAIGAVCGILACIGSSILMCCAPATTQEGGGKFLAVRKSTQLAATPTPNPYATRASKKCAPPPSCQLGLSLGPMNIYAGKLNQKSFLIFK